MRGCRAGAYRPFHTGCALLGEGARPFLLVVAAIEDIDAAEAAMADAQQGFLEGHGLAFAHDFLDGGEDQRRSAREQRGQLAGAGHQFVGRQDLVDQAALMGLGHLHPAAGQQQIHGDVIGDAPRQPQRRRIGQRCRP